MSCHLLLVRPRPEMKRCATNNRRRVRQYSKMLCKNLYRSLHRDSRTLISKWLKPRRTRRRRKKLDNNLHLLLEIQLLLINYLASLL